MKGVVQTNLQFSILDTLKIYKISLTNDMVGKQKFLKGEKS